MLEAARNRDTFSFRYYNQDHLGNNREVVDEAGNILQVTNYYPFGTPYCDAVSTINPDTQPFKYNGKELDMMHGMDTYDYGARQYSSILSTWDRVDPMAEKYYNTSPYVYCHNNPICRIDPNGTDDWEITENGKIVKHSKNKRHDAISIVDKKGKRIEGKTIEFKYGVISQKQRFIKKNQKYDIYKVKGDDNGTRLFEFFANNTKVEWSQFKTGFEKSGTNYLTTSYQENTESGGTNLISGQLRNGYMLRQANHSHPHNTPFPSGMSPEKRGDIGFAKWVSAIFGDNVSYNIYIPNNQEYIPYSQFSIPSDFITITLDGVTITY